MSKMECICGNFMSDCVYPCSTEGRLLGEQDFEAFDQEFLNVVKSFLSAVKVGQRDDWIDNNFEKIYPRDLSDGDIISDIFTGYYSKRGVCISECESCGRLWIQKAPGENEYRAYSPDEGGYAGVLKAGAGG